MKLPLWIKWIFFSIIIFTSLVLPLTFLEPSLANYGDLALEWAGSNKLLISFIVILALTADVLLPVPNGLTNTFAGMSLGWGISSFVVWIGLNMGAILAYSIGRFAGRPLAKKLISSQEFDEAESSLKNFNIIGLIISRPIPGFAELIAITAGLSKISFKIFLLVVSTTNIAVAIIFPGIGAAAVDNDSASCLWHFLVSLFFQPHYIFYTLNSIKTNLLMNHILKFLLLIPLIIASDEILDISEISYGSNEKQRIDLYKGTSDKVLVWIHGGGWLYGDKRAERWIKRFQNHFVDHENFNVYMVGYRVGEATAPNAVDDVICAYKKIISDASQRNFSTEDIIVAGASAGGHLALMVGLSANYKNNECVEKIAPKAIINIFGITEIKQTSEFLDKTKFFDASNYVKGWIGPEANIDLLSKTLSPINLLNGIDLNVLTIHGTSDRWVPYEQALLLDQKLGNQHQLLTIDGGGHYYFSEEEDEIIRQTISSFLSSNFNMSTREQQD